MNQNQIKDHIKALLHDIYEGIYEPVLKDIIKNKTFLAGGCFKSLLLNEQVNDYDFYFVDEESSKKFQEFVNCGMRKLHPYTDVSKINNKSS